MKIQNGFSLQPPTAELKEQSRDAQLRDAAKMYETHFLNEMVKAMRSTVGQEDGLIKRNMAEKIFSQQLDQQYVDGWSAKGGVGLADMIYTQIKEKYMGNGRGLPIRQPVLPIHPKRDMHGIGSPESIQMKAIPPAEGGGKVGYRFEVPVDAGADFEVQAPMPGLIANVQTLGQGWNSVRLDHGQGFTSELTFPGQVTDSAMGASVEAGQKLGQLDATRPALAWNLDWS